jgi:orotate phosphoribosyltransferase
MTRFEKAKTVGAETEPSRIESGYSFLAKLINENYFDIIITANYDNLLENALYEEGIKTGDFVVSILGVNSFAETKKKIEDISPRIKIVKIPGDYEKSVYESIDSEILKVRDIPNEALNVLSELINERDVIIIGHALENSILHMILEQTHSRLWYINTKIPEANIAAFSDQTKDRIVAISDGIGRFDTFFLGLYNFTRQRQTSAILRNSSGLLEKIIEKIKVDCLKKGDFLLSVGRKSHYWIDIYELSDYKELLSEVLRNYLEVSLIKQRRYTIVTVYHAEDSEKFFPTADVAEMAVAEINDPYVTHSRAMHNKYSGETTFNPSLQGECIVFNVISTHLSTSLDLVNTIRIREKKEINTIITFIEREEISRKALKSRNIEVRSFVLYDEYSNRFTVNEELLAKDLSEFSTKEKGSDTK